MSGGALDNLAATARTSKQIIDNSIQRQDALIRKNSDARARLTWRVVIPLDTASTGANPLHISDPFTGYYIENATSTSTAVKVSLTSNEDININNYVTVSQKDSFYSEEPVRGCYLTWAQQTGQTMTIVFFLGPDFRPGSFLTTFAGGVVVTTGASMTPNACVAVATGAATLIAAALSTNKKTTITNLDLANTVWISGTSGVVSGTGAVVAGTTLVGIPIPPGASYEWTNTGAIYGSADNATVNVAVNVEV